MSHRAESERRLGEALAATDRRRFLPEELRRLAREDRPLPIGHGQTNSQPTTVRNMLILLDVRPGQRVLDLGSGSGWTTALLARLCGPEGRVIGVERGSSDDPLNAAPDTRGVRRAGPVGCGACTGVR